MKPDLFLSASSNSLPKLVDAKLIRPLNRSYLTNFANVLPEFQDPYYDQGSRYSVPYTVFGTGILYRTDIVDPKTVEQAGWNIFWDPAFKGQVTILDDKREAVALALLRKGVSDVNTTDPKLLAQAGADLKELAADLGRPREHRGLPGRARGRCRHRPRLVRRSGRGRGQLPAGGG